MIVQQQRQPLPQDTRVSRISQRSFHQVDQSESSLPISTILQLPSHRPGRKTWASPLDLSPDKSYGDTILQKRHGTVRLFFQNVKGLTYSTAGDDYRYYLSCLKSYEVDIAGLAVTNTCWTHPHTCADFRQILRRQFS
jgi:hypothetical protein